MKLYYKKTDGGAEYYCLNHVGDGETGDLRTAIMRTDGNEIELFTRNIGTNDIKVIVN